MAIYQVFPALGLRVKSVRALTVHEYKHVCLCDVIDPPGPPDVEQPCDPSLQAWSPELSLYDTNVTSPCPDTEGCTLTLRFLHPVIPHTLTLWVTYISSSKCHSMTTLYHQFDMSGMSDSPTVNPLLRH